MGPAVEIRPGPEGDPNDSGRVWQYDDQQEGSCHKSKIGIFKVPCDVIRDGKNELVLRSENMSTTILGIDVQIG